jgi:hypothetical protein
MNAQDDLALYGRKRTTTSRDIRMAFLMAFVGAIVIGTSITLSVASRGGFEALGAIGGIGIGFIACIVSLVLAGISLARRESPRWPGVLGFVLSFFPAIFGAWVLCQVVWLYLTRN